MTLFDTVPGQDTSWRVNPAALVDLLSVFPYTFSTERTRTTQMPSRLSDAYDCFASGVGALLFADPSSCYGQRIFGVGGADLYVCFRDHLFQYLEGDPQYEVPIFMFHVPDDKAVRVVAGMADESWSDRIGESFVYMFASPRVFGPDFIPFGQTSDIAHEVGHHLGLHHPHDGFICADAACTEGKFISRTDDSYYSWLGDQQSSAMGYVSSNNDFGQFDLDSLDRYLTYTYLSLANQVLDALAGSPQASQYTSAISAADVDATTARSSYSASSS